MKSSEIEQGGHYEAKISGQIVTVRVHYIRSVPRGKRNPITGKWTYRSKTTYGVTNLRTGRQLTFKSAQKFRRAVERPT